jgi:hypothetical protein
MPEVWLAILLRLGEGNERDAAAGAEKRRRSVVSMCCLPRRWLSGSPLTTCRGLAL